MAEMIGGTQYASDSDDEAAPQAQLLQAAEVSTASPFNDNQQLQVCTSDPPLLESVGELVSVVQQEFSPFHTGSTFTIAKEINLVLPGNTVTGDKDAIPDALKQKMQNARSIFEETRSYDFVRGALEDQGCVVIAGSPGSGKTTMSLYLMYKYWKKKYKLKLVRKIRAFDFDRDVDLNHNTLLVFDDVFGYFNTTQEAYLDYKTVFEDIEHHFKCMERKWSEKEGTSKERKDSWTSFPLKIVFSTRTSILKSVTPRIKRFQNRLFKPSSIVDLTIQKLDEEEKKRILKKHLTKYNVHLEECDVSIIAGLEYGTLGYPYICELFVKDRKYQAHGVDFFERPLAYLNECIQEIFDICDSKYTAALLLLLLLGEGQIDLANVTDVTKYEKGEIDVMFNKLNQVIPSLDKDSFLSIIEREATNQINTFLYSEGDVVKFSHPTIYDAVAFAVGSRNPKFVLRNCSLKFIIERVKIAIWSEQPSTGDDYDYTIRLQRQSVRILIERLAKETLSGNFDQALSHYCLRESENADLLYSEIMADGNVKQILHATEDNHKKCFLFWVAFTCNSSVCRLVLADEHFEEQEIFEALLGSCMGGSIEVMNLLLEHCGKINLESEGEATLIEKVKSLSIGEILQEQENAVHTYHRLASSFSASSNDDLSPAENTPRLHGERRDQLIHIATVNGYSDIVNTLIGIGVHIDSIGGTGMTPLMYACYHGNRELAQVLIEKGASLELCDEEGDNCLHLASRAGCTDVAELLLESGVDINSRGYHERSPIIFASQHGQTDVVKFLLRRGAETEPDLSNITNKDNCLHLAALTGRDDIVELLVEKGEMNIEAAGQRNRTPLMFACRHGQVRVAQYLISKGADINAVDIDKSNCCHLAAMGGHNDTVNLFFNSLDINQQNVYSRTPLMYALMHGHRHTVQLLLNDFGADVTLRDKTGNSSIHFAARSGVESLVEKCLELGQSINASTNTGVTPIFNACQNADIGLIELLLSKGADYSLRTNVGDTCFHYTCRFGCLDVLKYFHLRFSDTDINQPGVKQRTPLYQACYFGHSVIVDYLLDSGANHELTGDVERSCSHAACISGDIATVKVLQKHHVFDIESVDRFGNTPLLAAVSYDKANMMERLLGIDSTLLETKNYLKQNALHTACRSGALNAATDLLQLGMDVNTRDKNGRTPLMLALCRKNVTVEIVLLLLQYNADTTLKNTYGDTCLHDAVNAQGNVSMTETVLDSGIDINMRGAYGQTPIMHACRKSAREFFCLYLERKADVKLVNDDGATALHLACMSNSDNVQIVSSLLQVDTSGLDQKDRHGKSPLMYAAQCGNEGIVRLLIGKGARLNLMDKQGKTCLDHAARKGHSELASYLRRLIYRRF